jgi:2-hydroxychromene-2-carboxylate isomerase
MPTLEFFFDCSSPWTYLAFHRIEEVARAGNAKLIWKPILVGGVFNAVNPGIYDARANPMPARAAYHQKDLADWARFYQLEIHWPKVFPVNSVRAMRGCLVAARHDALPAFARSVFEAYWGKGRDISEPDVLEEIAEHVGLDAKNFSNTIETPEIKRALRHNTDELVERGGYGSPTIFVNETDMYFGNDRLPLVAAALERSS